MKKPLILVTNDDGILSPGLRAVVEALTEFAELVIAAPSEQQTSMGRSLWGDERECFRKREYVVGGTSIPAYHCDWSPARIVLHALEVLFLTKKPELVVSGINYGENLGSNTTISGTIGAAIQAAASGVPALAVSVETQIEHHRHYAELDWCAARHFTSFFVKRLLALEKLPNDVDLLNVNVPADARVDTPYKLTRQSRLPYFTMALNSPHPASAISDGRVVVNIDEDRLEPDSDIHALVNERVVSVTPLSMDLTSRVEMNGWLD